MTKKQIFIILFFSILIISCTSTKDLTIKQPESKPIAFTEIWGYVFNGIEDAYNPELPVTDIGYFIKAVNNLSQLDPVPTKSKYFANTTARIHLTTSVDSRAQTHLLLDPSLPLRDTIIDQLVKYSETYDGIQVDWELVLPSDAENFYSFLKALRKKMDPSKMLTIAIPARIKTLREDAYNYEKLYPLVDRIIIMAYDQHWSTSSPGAVAETDWCQKICNYAKSQIPEEKLIMGMSFYGRAWRDDKEGGRAYTFSRLQELKASHKIKSVNRDNYGIPNFTVTKKMTITTWYDDEKSLRLRTEMYKNEGITKLSFWRLGQEDPEYWNWIKITEKLNNDNTAGLK